MTDCLFIARKLVSPSNPMKTALAAIIVALATPLAVSAGSVPDSVMGQITEQCNEAVADNSQATQSDENCIAEKVAAWKKANNM